MDHDCLKAILKENHMDEQTEKNILAYYHDLQRKMEHVLETDEITEELPYISDEEFQSNPPSLCLTDLFPDKDIHCTKQQSSHSFCHPSSTSMHCN